MKNEASDNILENFRRLQDFSAFEAFARALWDHQAAVMVGAGFSRLCSLEAGSELPPLWKTFKTVMEKELGYEAGTAPDALRLAQEYRTLHGENGMDQLIQRLIPDLQWEPGPLHKKLLEMPWRDVLTTNWDTLLERTKPETPDRIYSRVCTVQDIAHQPRPRIVKLHGTLPSHKPFVFTEDDYRTYPNRFSPFVNLAQQVMLGPVDKVWQPYLCGGQGEECCEGFSCLVVSGRNAPKLLEAVEHPLDTVSILVGSKVAGRRVLPACFRRDHRPDPMDQEFLAQEITIIAFVGKQQPRLTNRYCQQVRNGVVIRSFAACQDEAKRASLTICAGVDFRRKAAA